MRLNKFLALGMGVSRREADDLISAGRVLIDGLIATLGSRVEDKSTVLVDGELVTTQPFVYLAFNKPVGYVSSRAAQGDAPTLYELLPKEYYQLKTVGRLDKDSSGLLILTNDGDFAFKMTHPQFSKVKIYEVVLDHKLEPLHQQMIADFGVNLDDGRSQLGLTALDDGRKKWRVEMSEGRNRQIRRTFGSLGYTVVDLHRTQFGKYSLGGLKSGKFETVKNLV